MQPQFQSKVYSNPSICSNGMLKLIEFNSTKSDPEKIVFQISNLTVNDSYEVWSSIEPNVSPVPTVYRKEDYFEMYANCEPESLMTNQNYYNHIKVTLVVAGQLSLPSTYEFSFLLNCDRYNRHKKFEYGYLLIGLINAAITIGVAMHSRIWSIRFN